MKSLDFMQMGPCPSLQQLSSEKGVVLCPNRAAPCQEVLSSSRDVVEECDGPGLAIGIEE